MTRRPVNLPQSLYGIYYFLLQLPVVSAVFPFVKRVGIEANYMGILTREWVYGGLLVSNALMWFIGFSKTTWDKLKEKNLVLFVVLAFVAAFGILMADVNLAGILQRYMGDFTFGFALAAVIVALAFCEKMQEKNQALVSAKVFASFFTIQFLYSFFLIFSSTDFAYGLKTTAPEVFYRIAAWF
jgi:hypothetical protein